MIPLYPESGNAAVPGPAPALPVATRGNLSRRQWTQVASISLAALGIYLGFQALPTGTNLNHIDFRVTGAGSLEMCDPANPQFIPVVAARSPVSMSVQTREPARAGADTNGLVTLRTSSGKPVGEVDLLVAHTRKLHLLIVDPTLQDYQHVHPEPGEAPGTWAFVFKPRAQGVYRVFADFTPAATGRGLYASADLLVGGGEAALVGDGAPDRDAAGASVQLPAGDGAMKRVEQDGFVFTLSPASSPIRAGQVAELAFQISRVDGRDVPLEPVMGAFAHLVAFDEARSGFAHLHPNEVDLTKPPDATQPKLTFKLTIPQAGRYVIWAQLNVGGREVFVPFACEVI
jgi:hypothetical protein